MFKNIKTDLKEELQIPVKARHGPFRSQRRSTNIKPPLNISLIKSNKDPVNISYDMMTRADEIEKLQNEHENKAFFGKK